MCVERRRHVALNQADDTCFYCFFWTKTSDLFQRWILCNNLLLRGKICDTITAVESGFQPVKTNYAMPLLRLVIGLNTSRQFFNQVILTRTFRTLMRGFFRTLSKL